MCEPEHSALNVVKIKIASNWIFFLVVSFIFIDLIFKFSSFRFAAVAVMRRQCRSPHTRHEFLSLRKLCVCVCHRCTDAHIKKTTPLISPSFTKIYLQRTQHTIATQQFLRDQCVLRRPHTVRRFNDI